MLDLTSDSDPTILRTSAILDLFAAGRFVDPRSPVLIRGESGVGKDTLARLIHSSSPRRAYAFIKVNCAAASSDQHEADLFGRERCASSRGRPGSFEFANHGTLYLDEIGALSPRLVPKLLDVLRTGEVTRAGGDETIHVDVRLVASTLPGAAPPTCSDLWQELKRLDAVEICVAPLRERTEEIPLFAAFFLERMNRRYRRDAQVGAEKLAAFRAHSWPGNVRELEEAVHRLVVG